MTALNGCIFSGHQFMISLSQVAYVERSALADEICVVLKGSQHPLDQQGNYVTGYGRADCPYLSGAEKESFLAAWVSYCEERDGEPVRSGKRTATARAIKAYNDLYVRYKALGEEKALLVDTIQEALDNCEVCRDMPKDSPGRCARCQTFAEVLDTVNPPDETQDAPPDANG